MKKGFTAKQKMGLTIFLCVAVIFIVVLALRFTINKKITDLKNENSQLAAEYAGLQEYVANKEMYLAETESNNKTIKEIVNSYVGNVTNKSQLYDFDRNLEDYDMVTTSLTLNPNEIIDTVSVEDDTKEGGVAEYQLQKTTIAVSFEMDYENLMKYVEDTVSEDKNIAISAVTFSENQELEVDEEGNSEIVEKEGKPISGNLTIAQYSVKGSSLGYEDPDLKEIKTGIPYIYEKIAEEYRGKPEDL